MKKIIPVLLGADLNCYGVARAFHEAYGAISYAFGKYAAGESRYSRIIKFQKAESLEDPNTLCRLLEDFAKDHAGSELYLVPCTDEYALSVIEASEFLRKYYFIACPKRELAQRLFSKESFYEICREHSLPFPQTEIFRRESEKSLLRALPFPYPIIVKPSCSAEYWRSPFEGMKKVYRAENAEEAESVIGKIYSAGYENSIILQEFIPGGEDGMYVLTTYSDKKAKVRAACMGHVLLGEHTPKGLGNHVAILTEHHGEITEKLCAFLDGIGYEGFANFDIIEDKHGGGFKVLEINLRQGRSNYYMTASGMNAARLLSNDRHGTFSEERLCCRESFFWHTVPKSIIYNYITDEKLKNSLQTLISKGKSATTLFYPKDLFLNPLRTAYVCFHNMRYFRKYNIYR